MIIKILMLLLITPFCNAMDTLFNKDATDAFIIEHYYDKSSDSENYEKVHLHSPQSKLFNAFDIADIIHVSPNCIQQNKDTVIKLLEEYAINYQDCSGTTDTHSTLVVY